MMALLSLLALALAAPAAAAPSPERTQLLAELAAKCRLPEGTPDDSVILDRAWMLASIQAPERYCRGHDRPLALRLGRLLAEEPSSASGAAYGLLALFYEGGHGIKADRELARAYRRRAWLLRSRLEDPFKTKPQEARAYATDPESIAFLRARIARGAPAKERVWLAEALLARRSPGDVDEARTLLRTPEAVTEPSARLALAELALEPGASPANVADAAMRLRPVAPSVAAGAKARALISRLARLQLAAARAPEERWEAIQSLAAAAYAREAEPMRAFAEALLAANEGREPASVAATAPPPRILAQDYPVWAMRKEVSGVVRLRALVDPRGRIVFTEPTIPDQPPPLVETVRRIYASRSVPPLAIAERPTPYVWVAIPPFDFRITD
jgi:hypothetical protein